MTQISAGLLMYRFRENRLEVFLVHPGGPFWKNKDAGSWGIPSGLQEDGEDLFTTAKREFSEETGITLNPTKTFFELGSITYKSGKQLFAWAFEDGNFNPKNLVSNLTPFGWPEIDQGDYFSIEEAKKIIFPAQKDFLFRSTFLVSSFLPQFSFPILVSPTNNPPNQP